MTEQNLTQLSTNKYVITSSKTTISLANAQKAFYDLREQAANLPEMTPDEINAEIKAARTERKRKLR